MGKKPFLLLLGIIIITLMVFFLGGEEIGGLLRFISPKTIAALCLLQLFTLSLTSYQWYFLLKKKCNDISFGNVWLIYLAGNFVESVTPSVKLGGEATRIFLFRQSTSLEYSQLAGMTMVQKYLVLLPFLLLCSLVIISSSLLIQLPPTAYAAFILLALLVALLFSVTRNAGKKYEEEMAVQRANSLHKKKSPETKESLKLTLAEKIIIIRKFLNKAAIVYRKSLSRKEKHLLMVASLLMWILYPVKVYIAADMLGFSLDIIPMTAAVYTAYMVSMLPLLPGGLGSFEGSMAFMLTGMGLSPAEGLTVALVSRFITYWFPLIFSAGAAAYLVWHQPIRFTAVKN